MTKLNRRQAAPPNTAQTTAPAVGTGASPLRSTAVAAPTHEGGAGHLREARAELFLLCVAGFVAEDSFYENAEARTTRLRELVAQVVAEAADGAGEWLAGFVRWMRATANIRTAAVMVAAEAVHARLAAGHHGFNREIITGALVRADEPGEFIAYWLDRFATPGSKAGSKTLPKPVKRALADAAVRLYDEYATLRYDTDSHGVRFGDVVELAQPRTNARTDGAAQNDALLRHLIDRRHGYNTAGIPAELEMLTMRAELEALPVEARRPMVRIAAADPDCFGAGQLRMAGMTWEWLASWLQGPMDADAWKVALPTIGYMALLRNLRNLDEAGVTGAAADWVADRLADRVQVARSRQLPFRFLSAYEAVSSDRWREPLGKALQACLGNIPSTLDGTLVLVDTSGSMSMTGLSARSTMTPVRVGALFGVALAARQAHGTSALFGFADDVFEHPVRYGASVLRETERFCRRVGEVGHGTRMVEAIRATFRADRHRRVVLISDEQAFGSYHGSVAEQIPAHVPLYAFNLGGYRSSVVAPAANRHQLGGLGDWAFGFIDLIERAQGAVGWPWERVDAAANAALNPPGSPGLFRMMPPK
jgi:TROVE domain